MAQTMAMGQATGTAAALSLERDCDREVPVAALQARLRTAGAVLEMPTRLAVTTADGWRHNFTPFMSFVRTVLGDVQSNDLGVCYAHEHLIIDPSLPTRQDPDFLLDSVEIAVAELASSTRRRPGDDRFDAVRLWAQRAQAGGSLASEQHPRRPHRVASGEVLRAGHWGRRSAKDGRVVRGRRRGRNR